MNPDPLDLIREAVLRAAKMEADPMQVTALLLRIGAEISVTTSCLDQQEWETLTKLFWDKAEGEHVVRMAESMPPGEA